MEVAKRAVWPLTAFGSWYVRTAKKHPFPVAFFTSGIKTSAADLLAQKVVERREDIDWRRNATFTAFGFAYLGGVQYYLYNVKFVQWCGGITAHVGHIGVAPLKTFLDQAIHHPFLYFPTFFLMMSFVEQWPHPVQHAYDKWRNEIWTSCKALWMLWVPAQIANFAFVPRYLRVPFAAGVSFVWCVILSTMQGSADAKEGEGPQGPGAKQQQSDGSHAGSEPLHGSHNSRVQVSVLAARPQTGLVGLLPSHHPAQLLL